MDGEDLHLTESYVSSSGLCLSPEQKTALQTSLPILRSQNKFTQVYFWGKIMGVKDDYFIAQGVIRDQLSGRKNFYSLDCASWNLMPQVTDDIRAKSLKVKGRFSGDPSYEFEQIDQVETNGIPSEETIVLREEDRLAAVIEGIIQDGAIAPRGAFTKNAKGVVVNNVNFQGLPPLDAVKLGSYLHLREAVNLPQKSLMEREKLEPAIDFLDPIEEDIPKGSWALQEERGHQVTLRSLYWPGLTAYHIPNTAKFGYCYFGLGEKNNDIPFML